MPFQVVGWMGLRNNVLNCGPDPMKIGKFGGNGLHNVMYRENAASAMQYWLN